MQPINIYQVILAFSVLAFLILAPQLCQAQSTIHGTVLNSHGEPATNASVLLLRAKDSSLVKATICNKGKLSCFYYFSISFVAIFDCFSYTLIHTNGIQVKNEKGTLHAE